MKSAWGRKGLGRRDQRKREVEASHSAIEKRVATLLSVTREQRGLTNTRTGNLQSRAGILVGAAGLLGVSNVLSEFHPIVLSAATVLYLGAAVLGAVAMWPRSIDEPPPDRLHRDMMEYTPVDLNEIVLILEIEADKQAARVLRNRSILVVIGFSVLAAAWSLTAVVAIVLGFQVTVDEPALIRIVE